MTDEILQSPTTHRGQNFAARHGKALTRPRDGHVEPFPMERYLKFSSEVKIQSKDLGLVNFKRRGSQRYAIEQIAKGLAEGVTTFVILKSRQLGISTELLILDLFWACEHEGLLGVFAVHEDGAREKFRADLDVMLDTLPKKYRVVENKNNAKMLILKNQSRFSYQVAGQRSTTNKMGRSGGNNFLHSTETAFYGSVGDIAALNETLSDLYPHRLYIYESTANGFNHFEEMWQIAKQSPAQRAIFVSWWMDETKELSEQHPHYALYMPNGVRTPLNDRERDGIRAVKAEFGVKINAGQIAWYRYHLENKCAGDHAQMDQEQPWVPEDAFQSTGSVYFQNKELTAQMKASRVEKMLAYKIRMHEHWSRIELVPLAQRQVDSADLKIWELPVPQFGRYCIGVDPAYGSSPDNDDTVISVWRVFADLAYQVAEYATATISTYQCAWMIAYLGGLYRDCMVNLEITGPGQDVMHHLNLLRREAHEMVGPDGPDIRNVLGRMREFLYRRADSVGGGVVRGWQTTHNTKPLLMGRFKSYVELDMARVRSLACLEQMRKMRIDGGNIEAAGSGHDDLPIASALAVYAWAEWRMPELKAAQWFYERAKLVEHAGGEDPAESLIRRFLASKRINVKDIDQRTA